MPEHPPHAALERKDAAITLAVIEDEAGIRLGVVAIALDPEIDCTGSSATDEEAGMIPRTSKPRAVLMEINPAAVDCIERVRKLASSMPNPPILMLTIHQGADAISDTPSSGTSRYVLKPARAPELLGAIREVFSSEAQTTASIAEKAVPSLKQTSATPTEIERLSPREYEVLELLAQGLATKEIADRFAVTYSTVRTHIERLYNKLHVHSRSHAVAKYFGDYRVARSTLESVE